MNDQTSSIEAPLAQAPFNQPVDDHFPAPANLPVDCDGFAHVGFEGSQAPALPSPKQARAAWRLGERIIRRLRRGWATNLGAKSARLAKPKPANPIRAARARAVHSHAAHGGSRSAGDDGSSDGGDGPPRRNASRSDPNASVRSVSSLNTGWCRFGQFPSSIGRKINPGSRAYFSYQGLGVGVTGSDHREQAGRTIDVYSVRGRKTQVVLRERIETHNRIPISVYGFRVVYRDPSPLASEELLRGAPYA
jgi:hypothetical protein